MALIPACGCTGAPREEVVDGEGLDRVRIVTYCGSGKHRLSEEVIQAA